MSFGGFLHSKSTSNEIDRNTTLCLACSSSLPPLKGLSSPSTSYSSSFNLVHITQCCQRPICPLCISSNPRLARYDPCLACLGGVGVVKSQTTSSLPKSSALKGDMPTTPDRNFNLDGSLRDEDTFVLGEDDNDDETDEHSLSDASTDSNRPPPYDSSLSESSLLSRSTITSSDSTLSASMTNDTPISMAELSLNSPSTLMGVGDQEPAKASSGPCKYYLKRSDTLMGICLRFGVDSYEVCKLNNLPTSVMRTTPHLLHTRAFIILPANPKTSQYASAQVHDAEEKERIRRREENLVRERAERRIQTLMKEVDWRVAKAYVALAGDADERNIHHYKLKEMGITARSRTTDTSGEDRASGGSGASSELEILAVERYLDDNEWEAEERRAGRNPKAMSFTLGLNYSDAATFSWNNKVSSDKGRWWKRQK